MFSNFFKLATKSPLLLVNRASNIHRVVPLSIRSYSTEPATIESEQPIATTKSEEPPVVHTKPEPKLFSDIKSLDPNLQKALSRIFNYSEMSSVQQRVLSQPLPLQNDLVVKAKTGTGKTLAFLLAAMQSSSLVTKKPAKPSILIIAPTRELANQIYEEAKKLLKMSKKLATFSFIGGADRKRQIDKIIYGEVNIAVGTPGRILDLLENDTRDVKGKFKNVDVVVLDEVDRLLEIGFLKDIQTIMSYLPKERRNLFFSATMNDQVKGVIDANINPGFKLIDCVLPEDMDTHLAIKQSCSVIPIKYHIRFLYSTLKERMAAGNDSKIIVFFPSAVLATYMSSLFNKLGIETMELHSKMTQRTRTVISARFKAAKKAILFTTDVSARGVDYPNVSLVIQAGAPVSREQYIHRIGRTGRAGKEGEAILLLGPYEKRFTNELTDLPMNFILEFPKLDTEEKEAINEAIQSIPEEERREIFAPWAGSIAAMKNVLRLTGETFAGISKDFANYVLGLERSPKFSADFLVKLGFGRVPSLERQPMRVRPKMSYMTDAEPSFRKPVRSFIREDRDSDKPARSFDREDRYSDKPARSFDRNDRYSEKPARSFDRNDRYSEKPARSFDRKDRYSEKPARSFVREERSSEKPRKSFGSQESALSKKY